MQVGSVEFSDESKARNALAVIAHYPISDPSNMDAVNMQKVARDALSTIEDPAQAAHRVVERATKSVL
jgi:hypothetical protein